MKQIYDRAKFDAMWRAEFNDANINTALAERILRDKNNTMPQWMTTYLDGYLYVCNIFSGMMLRWNLTDKDEGVYCNQPWREEQDLYEFIYDLTYDMAEYYEKEIKDYNNMLKQI